jgi:hypothetical protein
MEVIKVEPDIDRETLLLVSHSEDSQLSIKEHRPGPFTVVSVEIEDKVGVTVSMENVQMKGQYKGGLILALVLNLNYDNV